MCNQHWSDHIKYNAININTASCNTLKISEELRI